VIHSLALTCQAPRSLRLGLIALAALQWTGWAHADPTETQFRAAARDLALQGAEAFDSGDYPTALDRFNRASALVAAPTLTVMQARSLVALGRWLEGLEKYRETTHLTLDAEAPEQFLQAVREAEAEGNALEQRLPRIEIRLRAEATQVMVTLDNNPVPRALLNVAHPIDPGPHRLVANAPGNPPFEEEATIGERQHWVVQVPTPEIAAETALGPHGHAGPAPEPPGARTPKDEPASNAQAWAWVPPVAFSVGGAGAGAAIVAGVLASQRHSRLKAVCANDCPPSAAADLEAFRLYRGLFFVSGSLAAIGIGVGTYFVVWGPDSDPSVALGVRPDGADLIARF
jgi:hypothetical protein